MNARLLPEADSGYFTLEDAEQFNRALAQELEKHGVILNDFYTRTEGLSIKTFIRRVSSTKMTGMRISTMEILLLMMLLLCPLSCRLHLGLRPTSRLSFLYSMATQTRSSF